MGFLAIMKRKYSAFKQFEGYHLSDDPELVEAISKALMRNNGHCPCVIPLARNNDTVCPCLSMRSTEGCKCGLYEEDENDK